MPNMWAEIGVIAALCVLAILLVFRIWASIYRKAGPHEALIIYGFRGTRIVKGGGAVILPMVESYRDLSLQLMSFDVAPQQDLYTKQGVAVTVEAVAQIKVKSDPESIKTAAEQFLTKTDQAREGLIRLVMEGHLRGIIGQLSVEQIVKEPEMVGDRMRSTCAEDMSKMGLANLKARVSNTTLTAGRQSIDTPVIAYIGNRALPSSFQGVSIHSAEFDNLSFDAGTFDRVSTRTEQGQSKFRSEYGDSNQYTDRISMAGVNYQPLKSLNTSLYLSNVEDLWNQYYFGATHELGDSALLSLSTGLNYYKTRDEGKRKLGEIDNDTYSLSLGLTHQAHKLSVSYQQVNGNEYFDYLHDTNAIFLANSLLSDFNGPNEKSLQVAYTLNMAGYGVPGLKFNIYNARGWGIDGTHYTSTGYDVRGLEGENHYEYGIGSSYTVQSGSLKDTTVRATYTAHRASKAQADGSLDEFRVVTTIPFNIL